MPYSFDEQRAPLISMRLYGRVSGDDLEHMLADFTTQLRREQGFAVLLDCEQLEQLERAQLQRYAGWLADNFESVAKHQRGLAFVTNGSARAALATLMRLQRMPMPVKVFESSDAGQRWVLSKLHGGLVVSSRS